MSNFDPNTVNGLVGLWDFKSGAENNDTGLADGVANDGTFEGNASASGDKANFDGHGDRFIVGEQDDSFDLSKGTIEVQFTQDAQVGTGPDMIVSRGEEADAATEGYFGITIQLDGSIAVTHTDMSGASVSMTTAAGLASPGDTINVKYSWDAATGAEMVVENTSTGSDETVSAATTGLTMEIGDNDGQSFTFAANESDDGVYEDHFDGSIDYVAVYDSAKPGGGQPPAPNNGPVDGEATGELMELGYDDSNAPTNQGGDMITEGDDLIYGNGDDDTIDGEGGDDTIYGDDGGQSGGSTREIFEWDEAPGFGDEALASGFTQNTGTVNVEFKITASSKGVLNNYETDTQNVDDLDPEVNEYSSFESVLFDDPNSGVYCWETDAPVHNVEFRINDIDGDGVVQVKAFDAQGNEIEVILSNEGSGLALSDEDGVAGNDTATSTDTNYTPDAAAEHSVLVNIPGPVSKWEIIHEQDGPNSSGINVTEIAFDTGESGGLGVPGDDHIEGNDGNDEIYGEAGNDTIIGGDGADTMSGGDDRDTFIGGTDGDIADGGTDGDDYDTLDLRGLGPVEIVDETVDADGDSTSGKVNLLDKDGEVVGTMEFSEIEKILTDTGGPGPVDGEDFAEEMGPGYDDSNAPTNQGGDQIDGNDGDDDTIFGNGGDDTIDSGVGDDTVDGGLGDDDILIMEEGNGIDNDSIIGGEDPDDGDIDTVDTSDVSDDLTVDITAPETGTITDGTDTTTFEEIEKIILGDGDDTVTGPGGSDTIDAGNGDNVINVGKDDSTLLDDKNGDGHGFASYGPFPAIPVDSDPNDDRDDVTTGQGNDWITTGDDADTITANGGNDTIDSGIDNDSVDGGSGDDIITAGEGADTVFGNGGNDTIYGGLGPSAPDALNIPDAPDGGAFGPDPDEVNGKDLLDGGNGNDVIYGEDDDDTIFGGNGADTLYGGIDDDEIHGDVGQDDLIGGQGADKMFGGDDRDEFFFDTSTDAYGDLADGGTGGNDVDKLDLTGLGKFEIINETVDADGDSTSGTVNFLTKDGVIEGTMEFKEIERLIICFTPGSLIATPRGEVPVSDLRCGDRVITRDDGVQEINWIGSKKLSAQELIADPKLRPVLIKKGSLGNNLPERDMMVSPNHRMLVANSQTHMLFNEREVLVAAKHLVGQPGIYQLDTLGTEYFHVMFERHEVILGDGAWTESFQPGDYSLNGIDDEQREEIFKLFPDLARTEGRQAYGSARQSLKAHEAKMRRQTMAAK